MDITDVAAVVTGGASGLGAATARALVERGARVAILDLNGALAEETAQALGGLGVACDVADAASTEAALARAREAHGAARVLVNCAGVGTSGKAVGRDGPLALDRFARVVGVNLIGTFNCIRLAAAAMQALEPLAREFAEHGIRVMTIAPGIFSTPMLHGLPDKVRDSLAASVPFPKRLGAPEEYASLVVTIVETPMLNGEVIRLDGAIRMAPR